MHAIIIILCMYVYDVICSKMVDKQTSTEALSLIDFQSFCPCCWWSEPCDVDVAETTCLPLSTSILKDIQSRTFCDIRYVDCTLYTNYTCTITTFYPTHCPTHRPTPPTDPTYLAHEDFCQPRFLQQLKIGRNSIMTELCVEVIILWTRQWRADRDGSQ